MTCTKPTSQDRQTNVRQTLMARGVLGALLVVVSPLVACTSTPSDTEATTGKAESRLIQAPTLSMPFPSGESHLCTQGNGGGTSHNASTTQHALDFDTPNSGPAGPVVSSVAGVVARVQTGCALGNTSCGGGFGNHVRLDHGGSYFTVYCHLSSVSVAVGQKLGRGQLVGYEGNTGNSFGDHVHTSLHRGNASAASMAPTVPYNMRARDVTAGGVFSAMSSGSFICGLTTGHVYQSDNTCASVHDSLATARPLTNNIPYSGEFCHEGDIDYFAFSGNVGAFSASVTSSPESISDCACAILDAAGVELPPGGPEGYVRNDGFNGSEGCACSLASASGATRYLKLYAAMPGQYILNKTLPAGGPPPPTGGCSVKTVVSPSGGTYTGTTSGTSTESGSCGGGGGEAVYEYTPSTSGLVTASTCGSSADTVLFVREGMCSGGTELACNDDTCGLGSEVSFMATAGTTYFIVVDNFDTVPGSHTLTITPPP